MKRIVKLLALPAIITLALGTAAIFPPAAVDAQGGSAPVTVVNTPLPVTLQGTGTVSGTVNAMQAGSWTVGVSKLPAVQLAPGATVAVSGGLSNTKATPIFTNEIEHSARQAHAVTLCTFGADSCDGDTDTATVPLGTRFVVENVSGRCLDATGSNPQNPQLQARLNSWSFTYQLTGQVDPSLWRVFNDQVRIYADAPYDSGIPYSVRLITPQCVATLSGRLVDVSDLL